jgi:murein DD-endopeptidase MepM/ murein hydrolase activator NlpD
MSSLHQDRLLVEGSEPVTGTASTLPSARGTRRRTVGTPEKKATGTVPTQRLGTAQQSGTTKTTKTPKTDAKAAGTAIPRAERAGTKAAATGTLASRAKAATVKAATAKAATAKAATAKAATAARAAAVTTVANRTASVRVARATRAAAPAGKAAAAKTAKPAAAKPAATKTAATPAPAKPGPTKAAAKPATDKTTTPAMKASSTTTTAKAAPAKAAPAKAAPAKATTAASTKSAPTKVAAPKAATPKAATPKTATPKTATPKTATPKTATAKAATTTTATAKTATAKAATKAPTATTGRTKTAPVDVAAPAVKGPRPTPHKRPVAEAAAPALVPVTVAELLGDEASEVVVVRKDLPAEMLPGYTPSHVARLPRFLRRRAPLVHRRPALLLAAALISSLAFSSVTTEQPEARATSTVSHSVSVADRLGIEAADPAVAISRTDAAERLGELAASRNVRDAEQAAAAQAQAAADQAAAAAAAEAARPKAVLPVQGARLTSTFGPRWGSMHSGLDLAAPMLTPEFAVMDGVVLEAGPASGYGNAVYIQHDNGDVTVYGHMEEILVTAGQVVKAGDTIALLGNRGQSTGPHLHFEVHVGGMNGTKIDPLPWLRERGLDI